MSNLADCRVCLINLGVWPIFGDVIKPDISMYVEEFGAIRPTRYDDFPKHICEECFKQLQGAILFRETAKRSDLTLNQRNIMALQSADSQKNAVQTLRTEIEFKFEPNEDNHGDLDFRGDKNTDNLGNDLYMKQIKIQIPFAENLKTTLICRYCNLNFSSQIEYVEHGKTFEHKRNYVVSFWKNKKKRHSFTEVPVNPKDEPLVAESHEESYSMSDDNTYHYNNDLNKNYSAILMSDNEKKVKEQMFLCKCCNLNFINEQKYEEHRNTVEHKRNNVISFLLPKQKTRQTFVEKKTNEDGKMAIDFVSVEENVLEGTLTANKNINVDGCHDGRHFMSVDNQDNHNNDLDKIQKKMSKTEKPEIWESGVKLLCDDEEKDNLNCEYCKLNFSNEQDYTEHLDTITHKRNYVISFMAKENKETDENITVENQFVNPKRKKCDICNKNFTRLYYTRHMQTVHNITVPSSSFYPECPLCKNNYSPSFLPQHMRKIHGVAEELLPDKMECNVCKKMVSLHFFYRHMERHKQGDSTSREYICDQCGKMFLFQDALKRHHLTHINDFSFKCDYCPYKGRTKSLLSVHIRTHTGDYPYKCTQCDTRCITKSNLTSHMRRHRGPVDFICDTCNRGFYTKIELERHIAVTHYGVRNHVCDTCGAAFGYKHSLSKHQLQVHKRPKGLGKAKASYLQIEEQGLL